MALDSNSPDGDRGGSAAAEKSAATGLKLVSERGTAPGSPAAGSDRTDAAASGAANTPADGRKGSQTPGRQLPLWLFATLFVLFLIGYGYQTHHASRLEAEVQRLGQSLSQAEARLESHRTHLLEIRSGAADLAGRLETLRALIDRDPTASVEPPPGRTGRGDAAARADGSRASDFEAEER